MYTAMYTAQPKMYTAPTPPPLTFFWAGIDGVPWIRSCVYSRRSCESSMRRQMLLRKKLEGGLRHRTFFGGHRTFFRGHRTGHRTNLAWPSTGSKGLRTFWRRLRTGWVGLSTRQNRAKFRLRRPKYGTKWPGLDRNWESSQSKSSKIWPHLEPVWRKSKRNRLKSARLNYPNTLRRATVLRIRNLSS